MTESLLQMAEIEIRYSSKIKLLDRPCITTSSLAYEHFMTVFKVNELNIREEAIVMFLDRSNRIKGFYKLSCGGITSTTVDIRLILGLALKALATAIILAHSHPSGKLSPSHADKVVTQTIKEGAKLLDIQMFDHLIITEDGYYSFADEGAL